MNLEATLWRAVAVYRFAALVYATVVVARTYQTMTRPWLAFSVIGVMTLWSVFASYAYSEPQWRRWPLLIADMAVSLGCLIAGHWAIPHEALQAGAPMLPVAWVAACVISWGIAKGRRWAAVAALMMGAADVWQRGGVTPIALNGIAFLLLAGVMVAYVAAIGIAGEQRLARALQLEAATRERERLARGIHDSVLQVLALVQRRGAELGGEAAELGRLAGVQEATLRALVGMQTAVPDDSGETDLRVLLGPHSSPTVSLALPATPVFLPGHVASELAAATASALDNVRVHCGPQARAWVLVEDEESPGGDRGQSMVTVTIRDDGPGIAEGRLDAAERDGRLGVAQSIRGRLRDLGGSAIINSSPGEGTEVELKVSR